MKNSKVNNDKKDEKFKWGDRSNHIFYLSIDHEKRNAFKMQTKCKSQKIRSYFRLTGTLKQVFPNNSNQYV